MLGRETISQELTLLAVILVLSFHVPEQAREPVVLVWEFTIDTDRNVSPFAISVERAEIPLHLLTIRTPLISNTERLLS
jgi:hypothetical protein